MNYCPTLWSVVMSLHDVRSEIEILGVELASRYVIYFFFKTNEKYILI